MLNKIEKVKKTTRFMEITEQNPYVGNLVPSVKFLVSKRTSEKNWLNVVPPLQKVSKKRMDELNIMAKSIP